MNSKTLESLMTHAEQLKIGIDKLIEDIDKALDDSVGKEDVDFGALIETGLEEMTPEQAKIARAKLSTQEIEIVANDYAQRETIIETDLKKSKNGREFLREYKLKKLKAAEALEGKGGGSFKRL